LFYYHLLDYNLDQLSIKNFINILEDLLTPLITRCPPRLFKFMIFSKKLIHVFFRRIFWKFMLTKSHFRGFRIWNKIPRIISVIMEDNSRSHFNFSFDPWATWGANWIVICEMKKWYSDPIRKHCSIILYWTERVVNISFNNCHFLFLFVCYKINKQIIKFFS